MFICVAFNHLIIITAIVSFEVGKCQQMFPFHRGIFQLSLIFSSQGGAGIICSDHVSACKGDALWCCARMHVCVRALNKWILLKLASPWHVFDVEAETGLTEDEVQG